MLIKEYVTSNINVTNGNLWQLNFPLPKNLKPFGIADRQKAYSRSPRPPQF